MTLPSSIDIPSVFTPAQPTRLKSDLERMAAGLKRYIDGLTRLVVPIPTVETTIAKEGTNNLKFDALNYVKPSTASTLVFLALPQPSSLNIGRSIHIVKMAVGGPVVIKPTGDALINGQANMILDSSPRLTTVLFDGTNYWASSSGMTYTP